ncbi:DNA topoisomerase IV subunit B [Desulfobulbus propionicus DSM 2032]|uniref:DNA topoisomerase (ATP-hydrolyzing) n=1 Tax=Desulfobulbus propionicus (strain ATCC 33891 / DSM 2032 / VKM B-1956 / 1pr3) TaxID=577650 RepID=A0A7U3YLN0_DESPD|nr:DNA topoisomerase IV subunit B [Desulfobulbus propionicus]ADW17672.1 DNA topoisomerase IV subunit B [Desulfobulbus propionicus DSM 2032]
MTEHQYDESKIKTLSSLEHIRKRPGMYIGRLGDGSHPDDGIYILLKEILDNAVDEFIMGHGKRIDIHIGEDGLCRVRDYGRGIPLGKVVECVSVINTGAKYNTEVFQFSVGLNGVGTKAVNALSSHFTVTAFRDGRYKTAVFAQGLLQREEEGETTEKNGTLIEFLPDSESFPGFRFDPQYVDQRLWRYAYLNAGLSLYLDRDLYLSKNGLLDLLDREVSSERIYPPIHFVDKSIEFAFTHTDDYGESYFSFVNGTYTSEGGTHLSAFREGILKGINEFTGKKFNGLDVRDGIVGILAVKVQEPVFESQTKNKLGNTDIRGPIVNAVKDAVATHLYKFPETAEVLVDKVQRNERVRRELQSVRRDAKAKAKKIAFKIPQLKDCKYHPSRGQASKPGRENMLFITEGQSAAGSIVSARDPMTQAVFSLKGKPMNVLGQRLDVLYKNEEMYSLMQALNIEDSIADLRYDKVILATDADVDGLHIRNLLLTFFLHYFEQLIKQERVYILETPIFRVRNKEKTFYCYSDRDMDEAITALKVKSKADRAVETTRFKGLGEISPPEFKQFIGQDMRLRQVRLDRLSEVSRVLKFYMGKNTPERKQYIMDHLIVRPV